MKTVSAGSLAPDFELPDQDGKPVRLSELLLDQPVVLFFYPAALTPGCTKESCRFRDLAAEFRAAGAQPVGISTDTVAKQRKFADDNGFDYPILSDESGEVAVSFGVLRRFVSLAKRVTFVIDTHGVIRKVVASEVSMNAHAERALAALARL
jgi:peroxiredoxin Q/BCP